jgi:hypothetical protein
MRGARGTAHVAPPLEALLRLVTDRSKIGKEQSAVRRKIEAGLEELVASQRGVGVQEQEEIVWESCFHQLVRYVERKIDHNGKMAFARLSRRRLPRVSTCTSGFLQRRASASLSKVSVVCEGAICFGIAFIATRVSTRTRLRGMRTWRPR